MSTKVLVLGASNKPERYSYKAIKMLLEKGYEVIAVHPKLKDIEGLKVHSSLQEAAKGVEIDTITLYVNSEISSQQAQDILSANPKRVIFNPGTENVELLKQLNKAGIESLEACTLVMLSTGQF